MSIRSMQHSCGCGHLASTKSYKEMSTVNFAQAKKTALDGVDLSKKGSVDEPILELIQLVNSLPQYFTTSSCSGRTIIVAEGTGTVNKKKGCQWLYVTHGDADETLAVQALLEDPLQDTATLKFEPFIMHVQCLDIDSARRMLQVAVACGYRNSGVSIGKSGKLILAVRSTAGLEVPLVQGHRLLVEEQYVKFLIQKANEKMKANHAQITRLLKNLTSTQLAAKDSTDVRTRRHKCKNLKYKNSEKTQFSQQPGKKINGCVEEGGVSDGAEECVEECLDSLMLEGTL